MLFWENFFIFYWKGSEKSLSRTQCHLHFSKYGLGHGSTKNAHCVNCALIKLVALKWNCVSAFILTALIYSSSSKQAVHQICFPIIFVQTKSGLYSLHTGACLQLILHGVLFFEVTLISWKEACRLMTINHKAAVSFSPFVIIAEYSHLIPHSKPLFCWLVQNIFGICSAQSNMPKGNYNLIVMTLQSVSVSCIINFSSIIKWIISGSLTLRWGCAVFRVEASAFEWTQVSCHKTIFMPVYKCFL